MSRRPEPSAMTEADAAARLRYADGVRTRTRRAVLLPSFGLLALLGVVLAAHGLVRALSLHGAVISIAWIAALFAARPILLRYARGLEGSDLRAGARLLAAYALAGAAGAALAVAWGADPLVAAIAAATALRAYLAGMPVVALAALATGAIADALLRSDVPVGPGELALGAALIAAGAASRIVERARA
jgi:hypothetical protein